MKMNDYIYFVICTEFSVNIFVDVYYKLILRNFICFIREAMHTCRQISCQVLGSYRGKKKFDANFTE